MQINLNNYTEDEIVRRIVDQTSAKIIQTDKYWGKVPEEGHYSAFDRFKNQVANLVAEKIYQDILKTEQDTKVFENKIADIVGKVEIIIHNRANKLLTEKLAEVEI